VQLNLFYKMQKKLNVGVLFGGKSAEHIISIKSAKNIVAGLDRSKYNPVLIGVDQKGSWFYIKDEKKLQEPEKVFIFDKEEGITLHFILGHQTQPIQAIQEKESIPPIDVIFPIIHGPYGEDGALQGLLKLANIPFVGASVLGSAVGMDKEVMKRLLKEAGIATADYFCFDVGNKNEIDFKVIEDKLGLPLFVKPANLGSSIGISKVNEANEFEAAIELAFKFDRKIIIEEQIEGRELECALLGNYAIKISVPGEVVDVSKKHSFYSYQAKYFDADGAVIQIPAELTKDQIKEIQLIAVQTYQALCCEGLARVDIFLNKAGEIYVNEINTLPGFTNISMYPKLWEVSGISYAQLLTDLIELALKRSEEERALSTEV